MEWLVSLLPENTDLTDQQVLDGLPKEKYFYSLGQKRLNAYTHRWVRQRLKKVIRHKPIDDVTMYDIENA